MPPTANTETVTLTFKQVVQPASTGFISSKPHTLEFNGTLDVEGSDRANIPQIQAAFQKQMSALVTAQTKHLNTWISEKEAILKDLFKEWTALKKQSFPNTVAGAKSYAKKLAEMNDLINKTRTLREDYGDIVESWAENCAKQQGLIALDLALKKARIDVRNAKNRRVWLGKIVKGVLVVGAIILGIAAVVASGGTLTPFLLGLAITGVAITSTASLVGYGKLLLDNANQEKRLLGNIQKDMESLSNVLKPIAGTTSNVAKHVTEMENLIKIRSDKVRALNSEFDKMKALFVKYEADLNNISGAAAIDPKDIESRKKVVAGLKKSRDSIEVEMNRLTAKSASARQILDQINDFCGDLNKINAQTPNTIIGNLKQSATTVDGWVNASKEVGALFSGISGSGI